MSFDMRIDVAETVDNIDEFARLLPKAVGRGLYGWSEQVMTRAKGLCPVDTGTLRSSGHVSNPESKNGAMEVTLGFGGPAGSGNHGGESNGEACGYAEYVHENLAARHTTGQAKFLESPLMEATGQLSDQIQQEVDSDVKEVFK